MDPIPSVAEKSLRRSRLRLQILLSLSSLGEAYLGQLARCVGSTPTRVRWCLFGHPPYYRRGLSLVRSRLVAVRRTPNGRVFSVTTAGRRKARSVVRAWRGSRALAPGSSARAPPVPVGFGKS